MTRKAWLIWCLMLCGALISAPVAFIPGKIGEALHARHRLDGCPLKPSQGTVQFWIRLDRLADQLEGMIISLGGNKAGWSYARLSEGGLVLTCKEFFEVKLPMVFLNERQWHNLAWVWGTFQQKSFISIYVDGEIRCQQFVSGFPDSFPDGHRGLLYNTARHDEPTLPAALDEMAFYDIALDARTIRENYARGCRGEALAPSPGCAYLAAYDGDYRHVAGPPATALEAMKMARRASRKAKIRKYRTELDYEYSLSLPFRAKYDGVLNDGNDSTGIYWKDNKLTVICELTQTCQITRVEVVTRKHTKWYMLKELQLKLDDGSGMFGFPKIMKTYYCPLKRETPLIDETCRHYVYAFETPGKACRLQLSALGDAHMNLTEIRICGHIPDCAQN